jgi:hypothetical protein
MNTQPEALRLAKELVSVHQGHADEGPSTFSEAAVELCRLYELAQEQHTEIYGLRLKVRNLHSVNADLLESLIDMLENHEDACTGYGEGAADKARAAIKKATGAS